MSPFEEALREFVGQWQDKGTPTGVILDSLEMVADTVKEEAAFNEKEPD